MKLVSDEILIDTDQPISTNQPCYPVFDSFDFWNPSSWTDGHPFELYREMREHAPVMWSRPPKGMSGFWSVTRYNDIKEVELAHRVFSSQRGSINMMVGDRKLWKPEKLAPAAFNSLINLDAPAHMEMRMQQSEFFFPAYIETLRDKVEAKIDAMLDELERQGPVVDFAKLFSEELPLFTLCEMLGIDEEDRPRIKLWMHHLELAGQFLANPWQTFLSEPMFPFRFNKVVQEMFAFGERIMKNRRANPRNDY